MATINSGGMAIACPRTQSCSKTTARHKGWQCQVSVSWATPRPSPKVVRRPMSGRPISTAQPPVTVADAMRGNCPERRVPRTQKEAEPLCGLPRSSDATPTRHEWSARAQHNVVLRRRWRSATQVTQSDGKTYTGTGGAWHPRTPPVRGGGCAPPCRACSRANEQWQGEGKSVCVCVVVVVEFIKCTLVQRGALQQL